jgi:glyoxylase-like metal-dependent hydrolase (beta-lactamase superfamily II)
VLKLHAFTCGWLTGPLGLFFDGEHGKLRVPVPVFLIDHPKGRVLFDTGLHPDVQHDPRGRLGFLADVFHAEFRAGEEVGGRLAALGVAADRVDYAVLSHLHFDHAGGLATIPNARVVVQRREWEAGHDAERAAALTFTAHDYDHGHDVLLVDGEHDLFGDGRVVCLPTHGHTPGHQSLRVRLDGGDVVLTSDACYLRRTLETEHLPPQPFDRDAMLASLRRLRALRDGGARLVYGHDAEAWETVPPELA